MLKAIHASEDIAAAREKAIRVIEKLRGLRLARAADLVEAAVEETLAYYAFPEEHWWRIRTTDVFREKGSGRYRRWQLERRPQRSRLRRRSSSSARIRSCRRGPSAPELFRNQGRKP